MKLIFIIGFNVYNYTVKNNLDILFKQAVIAYQASDWMSSLNHLQTILKRSPDFDEAWHMSGLIYFRLQQIEKAVFYIQKAISLCQSKPVYYRNHGHLYMAQEKWLEAAKNYQQSLTLSPDDFETILLTGDCYKCLEEYDLARDYYQQVLELNPNSLQALNGLAKIAFSEGQLLLAIEYFKEILEKNDQLSEIHLNLAHALSYIGHLQCALEHYEQALQLQPNLIDVSQGLIYTHLFNRNIILLYLLQQEFSRLKTHALQALKKTDFDLEGSFPPSLYLTIQADYYQYLEAIRFYSLSNNKWRLSEELSLQMKDI